MRVENHDLGGSRVAEVIADGILISNADEGLALLGDLYHREFDKIIIYENNISPKFFDLKNGMAGEILQKFSNYRVRLVIVGEFTKYGSKSLSDLIYESNRGKQINFLGSLTEAFSRLEK